MPGALWLVAADGLPAPPGDKPERSFLPFKAHQKAGSRVASLAPLISRSMMPASYVNSSAEPATTIKLIPTLRTGPVVFHALAPAKPYGGVGVR